MTEFWNEITTYLSSEKLWLVVRATILLIIGLAVAKLVSSTLARVSHKKLDSHRVMLLRRGSYYLILGLFAVSALHELGFNLSVLLGAAGILTVAIGFASQTSASNLISGLFLVAERPFTVGDIIRVGTTSGEVLSIDLLSVKLRTFDNLFVRIPNESLIKSEVTTLTRFPIRRIDVAVGVAYKEDINQVRELLEAVADKNPLCLEEPKPLYIFQGFGESSLNLQFSVWAKRENFLELKNLIHQEIKEAFDAHGIEIPFPHRTLYTGSVTTPFPLRMSSSDSAQADQDRA
ncbi:mechanosensitive ion channel protein [Candidatus Tenderia electrophaga]|jgi:small-conductance mechanosensitive channel|uniref:Small-conductance mechanosensitive channel n=1 Tax=Candidatus Tenderia electrophaga TaxID=1748243 RepID=A0A0S2TE71_9GAMM|nr:mechanosensitive ion channel protein [Candidatus Tenderia electrophaga]